MQCATKRISHSLTDCIEESRDIGVYSPVHHRADNPDSQGAPPRLREECAYVACRLRRVSIFGLARQVHGFKGQPEVGIFEANEQFRLRLGQRFEFLPRFRSDGIACAGDEPFGIRIGFRDAGPLQGYRES